MIQRISSKLIIFISTERGKKYRTTMNDRDMGIDIGEFSKIIVGDHLNLKKIKNEYEELEDRYKKEISGLRTQLNNLIQEVNDNKQWRREIEFIRWEREYNESKEVLEGKEKILNDLQLQARELRADIDNTKEEKHYLDIQMKAIKVVYNNYIGTIKQRLRSKTGIKCRT